MNDRIERNLVTLRDGKTTLDTVNSLRRRVILDTLFAAPACPDGEGDRACRYCEAHLVATALENWVVPG